MLHIVQNIAFKEHLNPTLNSTAPILVHFNKKIQVK